jgi:putative ABC transport system permease protein
MMFISSRAGESFLERSANDYDGMYIISENAEYNDYIQDALEDLFPDMSVISPKSITDIINKMVTAIAGFVDGIAVVALGVAAVGIVASLYTSMMERTREIGTLKALGFSKKRITALFLYEALIIGVVGGGLGVLFGVPLSNFMNLAVGSFAPPKFLPIFRPQMFVFTFVLCVALSLIAGIYPAWRAAQMDPVVALRKE